MARIRLISLREDGRGNPSITGVVHWETLHYGERLGYFADGAVLLCDPVDAILDAQSRRLWLVTGAVDRLPVAARRQRDAIAEDPALLLRLVSRGFVQVEGESLVRARSVLSGETPDDDEEA